MDSSLISSGVELLLGGIIILTRVELKRAEKRAEIAKQEIEELPIRRGVRGIQWFTIVGESIERGKDNDRRISELGEKIQILERQALDDRIAALEEKLGM